MALGEPVYDLCSVLKALHHNGVSVALTTEDGSFTATDGGFRAAISGDVNGARGTMESTFLPDEVRHIAGWLKRASVHLWGVNGIDWDKGSWEIRK